MNIIYIIAGMALGILAAWFAGQKARKEKDCTIDNLRSQLESARTERAAINTELQLVKENYQADRKKMESAENENRRLNAEREGLIKETELMRKQASDTEKRIKEQMEMVQERMTNITGQMLKARSIELEQNNSKSMENVVAPLKERLKELQELVRTSRDKSEENTASVKEQIRHMMERTKEIGDEATRLTKALTHNTQFQGSMGEQVLGNILDSAGLRKGRDYEEQVTIKTDTGDVLRNEDTGQKMRPDVILHFPDKKDAIIDSKVSLTAYERYVNATDEAEKTIYLKQHIESFRKHVDELSAKNYNKYLQKPHTTIDFVIMFVPFEGAFQTAMQNDPQLWTEALKKNVCIAGELNLTVILRMIRMSWTQFDQTQNQEKVFKNAEILIKRVGLFCKRFSDLGKSLENADKRYKECYDSLEGRQNLLTPARNIVKLGAKDDPRIPRSDNDNLLEDIENEAEEKAED